ncbi:dual specificity mitogen-activated protein kinase kinase 7-like isoform X3 [Stylophora pistillata]|uniref:dual specificity mitogen-activated protein kinase kinase 7-like isoform X3 n=1 Tax=Stylophora pistillata TaxID=50429 RepID=UPI000C056BCA|nr:dual specificity mitogen-activated protein kinase kinase 7-like isoform X3 [Stylophora pistillata]
MATALQAKIESLGVKLREENKSRECELLGKGNDKSTCPKKPLLPLDLTTSTRQERPASSSFVVNLSVPSQQRLGRHRHLPQSSGSCVREDDSQIEAKLQEITKQTGILKLKDKSVDFTIDDLEVIEEIGSGTCGQVCKMMHKNTGDVLAVKKMRRSQNKEEQKRIIMDLEVVMKCHGCPFIVNCLGSFISKIVKALNYLKETHGVMHRDVKPSNVLLDQNGSVKLCDFGISGRLVDSKAKTRSAGCAAYMAPERIDPPDPMNPDYDVRADVWSLGITLVELATGEFPYRNCTTEFEVLSRVMSEDPPLLPRQGFSASFYSFVKSCLIKDYRYRPKYNALLKHPFILGYEQKEVNLAGWLAAVVEDSNFPGTEV